MPARDWHRVVHAIADYPTSARYGQLKCGALYVGRYSRRAGSAQKHVLLTVTVRDAVTCIGCLAAEES